jgi:hypothetical protein
MCGDMCKVKDILAEKLAGNGTMEDVGADGSIILKWILNT